MMTEPVKLEQYADAIVQTIRRPLLLLDGQLRVQFANARFYDHFQVTSEQTEQCLLYELGNRQWDIPAVRRLLEEVLPGQQELQNYEVEHDFPQIGPRTMLLNACMVEKAGKPELILLAIEDITEKKRLENDLVGQKELAEKTIDSVREPLLVLDWDLRVRLANDSFYEKFQVSREQTEGRLIYELGNGQWDIPQLRQLLENVLPENNTFDDYEVEHDFPELGRRNMVLNGHRIDHVMLILLAIEDVTQQREAERRRQFLIELSDAIRDLNDPDEVIRRVTASVAEHLRVSQATYVAVNEESRQAVINPGVDQSESSDRQISRLDDCGQPVLEALQAGRTLVASDVAQDPLMSGCSKLFAAEQIRAAVCVPVLQAARLVEVFTVTHKERRIWLNEEVDLIEQLAHRAHATFEKARDTQALRRSEEQFRALVTATSDIVFRMNPDWTEMRQLKGRGVIPDTTSPSQSWLEKYIPTDEQPRIMEAIRDAIRSKKVSELEHRGLRTDGTVGWAFSRAVPLLDENGKITEWFGAASDITARKQAEEALRRSEEHLRELNEKLEQRVAQRTSELQDRERRLRALAMELTRAEDQERKRLARVLHDHVQQLLVAAKMRASFVQGHLPPGARKNYEDLLEILDNANNELRSLSVELSPPVLHEQGLAAGFEWLAKRNQERYGLQTQVTVELEAEAGIEPLRDLLFQAVGELLLNVVKHAETGRAWVHCSHRNGNLQIEVRDAGQGFDPSVVEQNQRQSFGLFHLQERLRHIGGRLEIETASGQGTTVKMTVPLVAPPEGISETPPARPRPLVAPPDRVRVLVVDDHQTVREGLVQLLRRQPGLQVVGGCGDGEKALKLARDLHPDVIIMDVSLPGINGIEATRRMKLEMPEIRVIGLSLYPEDEMAQAMLQAGAEQYFNKAAPSSELMAAILGEGESRADIQNHV